MKIPNKSDWDAHTKNLFGVNGRDVFIGLDVDQASRLFEMPTMDVQEMIMFMPDNCFSYYIHSMVKYLLGESAKGDSDNASCFLMIIRGWIHIVKNFNAPEKNSIIKCLKWIGDNQDYYDASVEIYGVFSDKARELVLEIGMPDHND